MYCLFHEVFCFDGIHARKFVDRELGKIAHHGSALILVEDGAHVGTHARKRAGCGGVVGAKALAQFACDTLRKSRRASPGIDREGEFADPHGRLHREVAVVRICRVADEDARRARIGNDRRVHVFAIGRRNDQIDIAEIRARIRALVQSSVGTIEQSA